MITNRSSTLIPDLEAYATLRRNISGLYVIFDLVQLAQNLTLPSMDHEAADQLNRLRQCAAEVISYSLVRIWVPIAILNSEHVVQQDVVAFNNDQAQGNDHNLISVLITNKNLSVQGALSFAGTMIKRKFDAFVATEQALLGSVTFPSNHCSDNISSYWKWTSYVRMAKTPVAATADPLFIEDLPKFVQILKDCIVGTINWAYETELYFGTKGEEIRTFGWIFLAPRADTPGV